MQLINCRPEGPPVVRILRLCYEVSKQQEIDGGRCNHKDFVNALDELQLIKDNGITLDERLRKENTEFPFSSNRHFGLLQGWGSQGQDVQCYRT